jgi:hypothetical protein
VHVINESLSRDDVTFAAKPKVQLRAVPYGSVKKQLVRTFETEGQDVFSVFDAVTNMPADITGMAIFISISNSDKLSVEVKGKINSDIKGVVSFKVGLLPIGFYSYDISVRAKDYSESILSGSYVVKMS